MADGIACGYCGTLMDIDQEALAHRIEGAWLHHKCLLQMQAQADAQAQAAAMKPELIDFLAHAWGNAHGALDGLFCAGRAGAVADKLLVQYDVRRREQTDG